MSDIMFSFEQPESVDIRLRAVEDGVGPLANANNYRWKRWGSIVSSGQTSPGGRSTASDVFMAIFNNGIIRVWYNINVHYPHQRTRFDCFFYDRFYSQLGAQYSMGVQDFEFSRRYEAMETSGPWGMADFNYFHLHDASIRLISDDHDGW